ncbi:MAG: hypothetical protein SVE93_08500 [Candidatus Thermoplasmatota archaeon]|nr:hypothetical protein [Candidatus Thermoplasmatota archaeon]
MNKDKIKRGEIVHPWGSPISICTSDPYEDPEERKKQVAYWLKKYGIELSEKGKLVKVRILRFREGNIVLDEMEYIFPIERISFEGTVRFKRKLEERARERGSNEGK